MLAAPKSLRSRKNDRSICSEYKRTASGNSCSAWWQYTKHIFASCKGNAEYPKVVFLITTTYQFGDQ